MPVTPQKPQRLKGLALIAVAAVGYGAIQYQQSNARSAVAEKTHQGDRIMGEAIDRARQTYDDFFQKALKPADPKDQFRVKIMQTVHGEQHAIWVGGLNRRVMKAAFFIPMGESYQATVVSAPEAIASVYRAGSKISFDPSAIVDWVHRTADGTIHGGFTECVRIMEQVGRFEVAPLAATLKMNCDWLPHIRQAQR